MNVTTLIRVLVVITLASLAPVAGAQPEKIVQYVKDLEALLEELDAKYPFFHTKGIAKEWKATRARLQKVVRRRCKSDEQFFELVGEAMRCIRDGHAGLLEVRPKLTPPTPDYFPGVSFLPATKGRVVVMVTTRNLAQLLPPGTVVTRIDGQSARELLEARAQQSWRKGGTFSSPQQARFWEYRLALSGERGKRFTLHYRQGRKEKKLVVTANQEIRGWPHNYNMPEGLVQSARSVWHGRLESGFGYIYLRRIDETIEKGIAAAMEVHGDVDGWIVDLRGNTGGDYDRSLKTVIARLKRPVAAIIDAGCVSAGETLARDLVNQCGARLFGATSAGSSSSKNVWTFPSGIAKVRYSVRSRFGVKNKPIEFNGISPDEKVLAVPEELQQGKNSALRRAEEYLRKKVGG